VRALRACVCVCVCVVDYSVETIDLRWIQPKDSAVQFDPGGEDKSQFIIRESVLQNCSYNKSDGRSPSVDSFIYLENSAHLVVSSHIQVLYFLYFRDCHSS